VSTECWDDHAAAVGNNGGARATHLATSCTCAVEHYQYRWDELNRIHEARRYDGGGGIGNWELQVRQRYRYDAGNVRIIKETPDHFVDTAAGDGLDGVEHAALYVYPGDFERRGLVADRIKDQWDAQVGSETQYMIGPGRIVWQNSHSGMGFERHSRITWNGTDLLGSVGAVVDLVSGALLERSTYLPSGIRDATLQRRRRRRTSRADRLHGEGGRRRGRADVLRSPVSDAAFGSVGVAGSLAGVCGGGGEFGNSLDGLGGENLRSLIERTDAAAVIGFETGSDELTRGSSAPRVQGFAEQGIEYRTEGATLARDGDDGPWVVLPRSIADEPRIFNQAVPHELLAHAERAIRGVPH